MARRGDERVGKRATVMVVNGTPGPLGMEETD